MLIAAGQGETRILLSSRGVDKDRRSARAYEENFTMPRDHLTGLSAFAAVATHRSFTGAAVYLGLSASAVSHAVRELEARLGLRLLNRSTRSVALTEAGERYLAKVLPALEQLAAAADDLDDLHHTPSGLLRLNVSRPAYRTVLAPRIAAFRQAYPQITIELVVDDTLADIVAGGCDAGIRLGETLQRDMVAVPVSPPLELVLCAAPSYFAEHPRPISPEDLAHHHCIAFRYPGSGVTYAWELERDGQAMLFEPSAHITVNDGLALRDLALRGLGLVCTISDMVSEDLASGALERVMADWCPPFPGYFLYHSSRRHVPGKLRALIDHLRH
jgi:DNA-binding transcriptional LysR family regulator